MKKTFFLLLAISTLAFISCGKIQEQDNHETNSTEDAGCFEIVGIIHNTESSAPEVKTQYNIGPEYATIPCRTCPTRKASTDNIAEADPSTAPAVKSFFMVKDF